MSGSGSELTSEGAGAPLQIPEDVPMTIDFAGTRLIVGGVVDVAGSPWLDRAMLQVDDQQPVEIDLSGVEFIDSSGLRCLLLGARRAHSRGTRLRVVAMSECVARLVELTGTAHLFGS